MSDPILLAITMAVSLVGSIIRKYYSSKTVGYATSPFALSAVNAIVTVVILLLWGGFGTASTFTILLGIVFGIITAIQEFGTIRALEIGPMSYTVTIISFATVISGISGALFFHETLGVLHIVGIVLMLTSIVLAVEKKDDGKKTSLRWLIFSLVGFFGSGFVGVMQKTHQSSAYKDELNAFLIIAFLSCTVFSVVLALIFYRKQPDLSWLRKEPDRQKISYLLIGAMILCGVTVAVNNKLNLYLSGRFDSAVFFPIVNGGGLILSTLVALIVFREKLTVKQWIGILIGTAATLTLCLA